jgi:alpha-N-arabinofuranosidase
MVKLVNPQPTQEQLHIQIKGVSSLASKASAITLSGNPDDSNSISDPRKLVPIETHINPLKPDFNYLMPPNSIVVLKLRQRKP